jgi:hypothetical protein
MKRKEDREELEGAGDADGRVERPRAKCEREKEMYMVGRGRVPGFGFKIKWNNNIGETGK